MEIEKKISLPMKKALNRLDRGDMTALGMYKYLTERKPGRDAFSKEEAIDVVNKLIEAKFIDDKRYLLLMLEKCDIKLLGPMRIKEELKKKDFSVKNIDKALARDIDYTERAEKLLEKRKKDMLSDDSRENVSKLVRFLASNGYDFQTAYSAVVNMIKKNMAEE